MKDTIFEDYVFIKERIEFHCDKIIELLRLHSDLIFKTKKGDKLKRDISNHSSDIKNILIRKMDNFHLKDDKYENLVDKFLNSDEETPENAMIANSKVAKSDNGFDLNDCINPKEDLQKIMESFDFFNSN